MRSGPGTAGVVVGAATSAAVVLSWLADQTQALRDAGLDDLHTQILVVLATFLLALAWQVIRIRRLVRDLCHPVPAAISEFTAEDLGATRSTVAETYLEDPAQPPPYVERDGDDRLERILAEEPVVAIVGESGAGKTRSAYEAAREIAGSRFVLAPRLPAESDVHPLRVLLELPLPFFWQRRGCWLWLDDLGRHLEHGAVEAANLTRWLQRGPNRHVVATLNPRDQERYLSTTGVFGARAASTIKLAREHRLSVTWSEAERARARRDYRGVNPADERELSRHFAAGTSLLRRYRNSHTACQQAESIVHAAADWRRAGQSRPVAEEWLREAFLDYLVSQPVGKTLDELFEEGLVWATAPVDGSDAALLRRVPGENPCFVCDDIIVEHSDKSGRDVPPTLWPRVAQAITDPADRLAFATSARNRGYEAEAREMFALVTQDQAAEPRTQAAAAAEWSEMTDVPAVQEELAGVARQAGESARRAVRSDDPRTAPSAPILRSVGWLSWWLRRPSLVFVSRLTTLLVVDVLGLWLAVVLAAALTDFGGSWDDARSFTDDRIPYLVLLVLLLFAGTGLYAAERRRAGLSRVFALLTQAAVAITIFRVLSDIRTGSYELIWVALAFACVFVGGGRAIHSRASRMFGRWGKGEPWRSLLLGRPEAVRTVASAAPAGGRAPTFVGYLTTAEVEDFPGLPCLGRLRDANDVVRRENLDDVVICDADLSDDAATQLATLCATQTLELRAIAGGRNFLVYLNRYRPGDVLPLQELRLPRFDPGQRAQKRAMDIGASLLLLALTSGLWLLAVILIRLTSRGPVIQHLTYPRTIDGQTFGMRKFRTAYLPRGPSRVAQATPVGAVLRRLGIDELPQLLNVLRGEMSLVGPRPISASDFDLLEAWQKRRYLVPPGITGLWQISGRTDDSFDYMVRLDLWYVQKWSVFLDLEILLTSIPVTLANRRASLNIPRVPSVGRKDLRS